MIGLHWVIDDYVVDPPSAGPSRNQILEAWDKILDDVEVTYFTCGPVCWDRVFGKKEEKMSKQRKIEIVMVSKQKIEGKGEDQKVIDEKVLHEETRWVLGDLPKAEDLKDEFREQRGSLKPSEVEVRVFEVPFETV